MNQIPSAIRSILLGEELKRSSAVNAQNYDQSKINKFQVLF
jgi:hypothetical protein